MRWECNHISHLPWLYLYPVHSVTVKIMQRTSTVDITESSTDTKLSNPLGSFHSCLCSLQKSSSMNRKRHELKQSSIIHNSTKHRKTNRLPLSLKEKLWNIPLASSNPGLPWVFPGLSKMLSAKTQHPAQHEKPSLHPNQLKADQSSQATQRNEVTVPTTAPKWRKTQVNTESYHKPGQIPGADPHQGRNLTDVFQGLGTGRSESPNSRRSPASPSRGAPQFCGFYFLKLQQFLTGKRVSPSASCRGRERERCLGHMSRLCFLSSPVFYRNCASGTYLAPWSFFKT